MTDPNFVKIGENYFSVEWFDLERIEKMTHVPHGDEPIEDDWFPEEDDVRMVCPNCGSDDYIYGGEAYDDDQYLGSSYDCMECGKIFTMNDAFEE